MLSSWTLTSVTWASARFCPMQVVAYFSQALSAAKQNFGITCQELLTVVTALRHFWPYLHRQLFRQRTETLMRWHRVPIELRDYMPSLPACGRASAGRGGAALHSCFAEKETMWWLGGVEAQLRTVKSRKGE